MLVSKLKEYFPNLYPIILERQRRCTDQPTNKTEAEDLCFMFSWGATEEGFRFWEILRDIDNFKSRKEVVESVYSLLPTEKYQKYSHYFNKGIVKQNVCKEKNRVITYSVFTNGLINL